MSGLKRPADPLTSGPPEKRREREREGEREAEDGGAAGGSTAVETVIKLGGVSNTEEQDIRALQVKNRKLGEALDQRQVIEDELRDRAERLERRQATDDASLLILNRYWNQFDENVRLIGRRYDLQAELGDLLPPSEGRSLKPETPESDGDSNQERGRDCKSQGEAALSFLATLASSSSEEMEAELQERVESSRGLTSRLVEAYDALWATVRQLERELSQGCAAPGIQESSGSGGNSLQTERGRKGQKIKCGVVRKHDAHVCAQSQSLSSAVQCAESRVSELQVRIEELQWDMEKIRRRENRLNAHLGEVLERVNSKGYKVCGEASSVCGTITINKRKVSEAAPAESRRAMSVSRAQTRERKKRQWQPKTVSRGSYSSRLLSAVSSWLLVVRPSHAHQKEHRFIQRGSVQTRSREDGVMAVARGDGQTRRSLPCAGPTGNNLLRVLFPGVPPSLCAQFEEMNSELEENRELAENRLSELQRLTQDLQQISQENNSMRVRLCRAARSWEKLILLIHARAVKGSSLLQSQSSTELDVKEETASPLTPSTSSDITVKAEPEPSPATPTSTGPVMKAEPGADSEGGSREEEKDRDRENQSEDTGPERCAVIGGVKRKEVEQLKIVRAELKKAQESQREMKLLLDMYRSAPKEQRDKVQLMAAERKAKSEAEELRQRLRELEERERREGKKMADEEALRKIRSVEEQIDTLNKKLSLAKQEEEALLSEMDVTGQAFEDMQEQNIRLMQQLREKDDANFKLMSERIKSNQIHKLLKEEKEELADQLLTLKTQVDAQLQVVRKLEEKERLLQGTISTAERELALRTQALEMNKRKAVESVQLSEELRSQMESVQSRLSAVREEVIENSISREKESFNARRAQEDISKLRRKLEKAKKPENIPNCDEILNEEVKLTCVHALCVLCVQRHADPLQQRTCVRALCVLCAQIHADPLQQRACVRALYTRGPSEHHRVMLI
uniref:E3 ubiquitin protein ligase n=1 Tax=Lepisosteus oculatus TaxID=7918 RepID=W5MNG5_LEPOC